MKVFIIFALCVAYVACDGYRPKLNTGYTDLKHPDKRCKSIGQYLPHAKDSCRYLRCDYGSEPLRDEHGNIAFFTQELWCPPGTGTAKHWLNYNTFPCSKSNSHCTGAHYAHPHHGPSYAHRETHYIQPHYQETHYSQPHYEQPKYVQPKYEEPKYEEPKYEEPKYEEPKYEEPKYEEPKYEEPKYEEPKYEEPKYEEPKYEEPKYEEPKYEEPKYEEPKYEEPKYEEPKYEEPKYDSHHSSEQYHASFSSENYHARPRGHYAPRGYRSHSQYGRRY